MQRDLLSTINSMSARIKALERYEHALREIHKVIVVMRPGFNLQVLDPDAMPALIVQFFSDLTGRNTTHNINYRYDYNVGGALPFQPPPPQPFHPYGQYWPQQPPQPPPDQPQQPPPQQPPQPPPQPPPQQPPQPPPQPPPPQQLALAQQIELSVDEVRELQTLQLNMQQQTITWSHFAAFIGTMTRILQTRVVNSAFLIGAIEALQNVDRLTNYDFNEFLRCVANETALRFEIAPDLCRVVAAFIQFFQKTHMVVYRTTFTYVNSQSLTASAEALHLTIVKLFWFFSKIYVYVMKAEFVYTNSTALAVTIEELYARVEAMPVAAQNSADLARLHAEMRALRTVTADLQGMRDSAEQRLQAANARYEAADAKSRELDQQLVRLRPLAAQSETLRFEKSELAAENERLRGEIAALQSASANGLAGAETVSRLAASLADAQAQLTARTAEQNLVIAQKDNEYATKTQQAAADYVAKLNAEREAYERNLRAKEDELGATIQRLREENAELRSALDNRNREFAQGSDQFAAVNLQLNEARRAVAEKNDQLVAANEIGARLEQQLAGATQQLAKTEQLLVQQQESGSMETDKQEMDKEKSDYLLTALDIMYKNARILNPNLGGRDLSQNLNDLQFGLASEQRLALEQWFRTLRETTAPNDVLNFAALANVNDLVNDLKSQIITRIPANMLRTFDNRIVKPEEAGAVDNVTLISAVSRLVDEYSRLGLENAQLESANKTLYDDNVTLSETCAQQLKSLRDDLNKNMSNVAAINDLVKTTPELDKQAIQDVRTELSKTQSRLKSLKEAKLVELKQMASTSALEEMGKLNSNIREINSLLSKHAAITEDIFKWKTTMLEVYESLARTMAEENVLPPPAL